jgi:protein Tex
MLKCPQNGDRLEDAKKYLSENVATIEDALQGARDIVAEIISDNADFRRIIRNNTRRRSTLITKIKKNAKDEKQVYSNYYDYSESITTIKDHRILAINRAEKENVISVTLQGDDENNIIVLISKVIKGNTYYKSDLELAIRDSYKRLIYPSIEREIRGELTLRAETNAIDVFSLNLKNLLLQAPIKGKTVLGLDPAFRTGCKLAVVDQTGKLLEIAVIHPTEEYPGSGVKKEDLEMSEITFGRLVKKYNVDIVTIGNGTASRESTEFVANTIKKFNLSCKYTIVSEAGASVYSASKIAQEEFPDLTLEKRSAVSIARRIQDPLAELVKIEPKSIGVGQYQHDVDQKALDEKLGEVVEDAVNSVGVDLNTASKSLLEYVSGLNKNIAQNIVDYRNEYGKFTSRKELLKVSKLGEKTFTQCAGFIRVYESNNLLDKTAIHPESYDKALELAKYLNIDINDLGSSEVNNIVDNCNKEDILNHIDIDKYTLDDILDSFKKPKRDIRDTFSSAKLQSNQNHLEDLKIGDELEGTVRNVVDFGCFVDCGLHEDGLVHISKMSNSYVKHPKDLVKVGDIVKVYVIGIDLVKQKLSLSMVKDKM